MAYKKFDFDKGTTQDASKAIDIAAQISAISLAEPLTEKIVWNIPNGPTIVESKLSTDQEVLQPKISQKPATPSFGSSSYGRKQSRIPLSPANYASMHPLKENILTPRTKNSTVVDSIDKRRAASRYLYTLMNFGSVKESYKSNSAASRKIESTKATPSAHSTPKRCATPAKTPSKVLFADFAVMATLYNIVCMETSRIIMLNHGNYVAGESRDRIQKTKTKLLL
nr:hypothetical protein [Tanacetum cinerariifolium]